MSHALQIDSSTLKPLFQARVSYNDTSLDDYFFLALLEYNTYLVHTHNSLASYKFPSLGATGVHFI